MASALRTALLAGGALLALPSAALAEVADPAPIVVTARREAEALRDVPLSVNVVGADAISTGGVDSLQSLAARVPGLTFEAIWGGANSFPVLRGQNPPSVAGDAVGLFVDGVYQANRDGIDVPMLDLARVEVVHGPQSALFGHSSFAGLISYVPAEPTEQLAWSAAVEAGTDNLLGGSAMASGPVGNSYKARIAASWRKRGGTWDNAADPGEKLGSMQQWAIAGSFATRDLGQPLSIRLSARFGETRRGQPPFFPLDYRSFNCGGRDPASGVWSYYCGKAPIVGRIAISAGIPESRNRASQVALHLALDLGGTTLRSDSSWYWSESRSYRDFDGSAEGELFGVCVIGSSCTPPGSLKAPVQRTQRANTMQRRETVASEFSQELRLEGGSGGRLAWMVGGTVYWTRSRTAFAYGAQRGALAANERMTALVLANPAKVGPISGFNFAITDDPALVQVVQNDAIEHRRTLGVFASADWKLTSSLSLRGEVRGNWQRLAIDSIWSNFQPSFGSSLGARRFFDLTGRASVAWHPGARWLVFASHARGSRAGGINATANLIPDEQSFEPETNWTSEIGARYTGTGVVQLLELTGFRIDWTNAQITGVSVSPGVSALVVRNTAGIRTWGFEGAARLRFLPWLEAGMTASYAVPRFKRGSEDPGSSTYCGLSATSAISTFCTIRPSSINPGQLVPDISGKRVLRAAPWTLSGEVILAPRAAAFHGASLRVGVNYQDNVFERAVNGLYYGRRTLLDARLSLPLGAWTIDLWGTNLTDAKYVRADAGRPPFFYPNQPRPTDLILGEGRRIGLTIRTSG